MPNIIKETCNGILLTPFRISCSLSVRLNAWKKSIHSQ